MAEVIGTAEYILTANTDGLQDGDWGVWVSGLYGHVSMRYQGKWFGQDQGARDGNVGTPFNLMALPMDGFAGYFRPNIYAQTHVEPSNSAETPKDDNETRSFS